ncbi:hypothetical protein ACIGNX_01760 [Actinosynnema sp. NPDC053489]|uniref:hypothetical protein n=1 Tax=Actinosynnema sp. NPDC053489 TaxID=3363916 RepID=UPI0037CAE08A
MATKGNGSGGGDRDEEPSSTGGSGQPDFGSGSGYLSVDTDGLYRGGADIDGLGGTIHGFGQTFMGFISRPPLLTGEVDDTWERFAPDYNAGIETFVGGIFSFSQAVAGIARSVYDFAEFCAGIEENATYIGKNALNIKPPSGSTGGEQ